VVAETPDFKDGLALTAMEPVFFRLICRIFLGAATQLRNLQTVLGTALCSSRSGAMNKMMSKGAVSG
jgi:hypothetical protein